MISGVSFFSIEFFGPAFVDVLIVAKDFSSGVFFYLTVFKSVPKMPSEKCILVCVGGGGMLRYHLFHINRSIFCNHVAKGCGGDSYV